MDACIYPNMDIKKIKYKNLEKINSINKLILIDVSLFCILIWIYKYIEICVYFYQKNLMY